MLKVECDGLSHNENEMHIFEALLHDKDLLRSLVLYHHTTFISLGVVIVVSELCDPYSFL